MAQRRKRKRKLEEAVEGDGMTVAPCRQGSLSSPPCFRLSLDRGRCFRKDLPPSDLSRKERGKGTWREAAYPHAALPRAAGREVSRRLGCDPDGHGCRLELNEAGCSTRVSVTLLYLGRCRCPNLDRTWLDLVGERGRPGGGRPGWVFTGTFCPAEAIETFQVEARRRRALSESRSDDQ